MRRAIFRQLSFRSTEVDSVAEEEGFRFSLSGITRLYSAIFGCVTIELMSVACGLSEI